MTRWLLILTALAAGCATNSARAPASQPVVEEVSIELRLAKPDALNPPAATQPMEGLTLAGVVKPDVPFSLTSKDAGVTRTASGVVKSQSRGEIYRVSIDYRASSGGGSHGGSTMIEMRPGDVKPIMGGASVHVILKLLPAE